MKKWLPRIALMLGNFVIGVSVVLPTGILRELSADLGVSISVAGLLVTYGAVVLCIGSPLVAGLTSRMDRRLLLGGTLLLLTIGHLASAFATSYAALLALRLVILAVAAAYTPQAASAVGLIVSEAERPSAIAFVFLGWSLAFAVGLPLVTFIATHFGWQMTYVAVAGAALVVGGLLLAALPKGVRGVPLSLKSWGDIARNREILLLLLLTTVQTSGQFAIFTFMAPLLSQLAGAGPPTIALFFAIVGVTGFIGNVVATELVKSLKPYRTSLIFLLSMLLGLSLWAFGAGVLLVMGIGAGFWGLGFAAMNSMQQARLVGAAPPLASASVALNTSVLYIGQAVGWAIGGYLYAHDDPLAIGYVGVAFMLGALGVLVMTRPRGTARAV